LPSQYWKRSPRSHRLAIENIGAATLGDRHEVVEHFLLDLPASSIRIITEVSRLLEDTRRGEIAGRADFAQIGHHRFAGLRAIDGETGDQRLGVGKQVIADPGHRQVGENVAIGAEIIDLDAARAAAMKACGLADALRLAGGARGVEHHRDIVGRALLDLGLQEIRVVADCGSRPISISSSMSCRKGWV
jgi:hypothetical protein